MSAVWAVGTTIAGNASNFGFQGTQGSVAYSGVRGPTRGAEFSGDGFVDDTDRVMFAAVHEAFKVPPDDADCGIFAAAYEAPIRPQQIRGT